MLQIWLYVLPVVWQQSPSTKCPVALIMLWDYLDLAGKRSSVEKENTG